MSFSNPNKQDIAGQIQADRYNRERLSPQHGESLYIILSDLLFGLRQVLPPNPPARVLDYGCGGSPYRSLVPSPVYKRADFVPADDLDYVVIPGKPLDAEDQSFDMILSTQVAEHVESPASYFADCHRLLVPGGTLVISTHGTYPDHGCPYDFQRWTLDGMQRDLERAGFVVEKKYVLTAGMRAVLFLMLYMGNKAGASRKSLLGFLFETFRRLVTVNPARFHAWLDRQYPNLRCTEPASLTVPFYIGFVFLARRPAVSTP